MNIGSGSGYPSSALSNFAPHPFILDGININSMEGFLQSLKFKDPVTQAHVCTLVGKAAKFKGKKKNWWREQKLYWQGKEYPRKSEEYQNLLDRAYQAMFDQSLSFRNALKAANTSVFTHSIGKTDPTKTILTTREFCGRLEKLCKQL